MFSSLFIIGLDFITITNEMLYTLLHTREGSSGVLNMQAPRTWGCEKKFESFSYVRFFAFFFLLQLMWILN